MSDFVEWEPGLPIECVVCGSKRGGDDPPGPWTRNFGSARRRVPIYGPRGPTHWFRALGYLEYIAP